MCQLSKVRLRGLHVYYKILKLHKKLPPFMGEFGNTYVR